MKVRWLLRMSGDGFVRFQFETSQMKVSKPDGHSFGEIIGEKDDDNDGDDGDDDDNDDEGGGDDVQMT
ncbi:hypothetical protein PoB_005556300 [Plakobranchus ocellatus]|uniref:Uncharacterized protein n=1 Tax=Plakobranchus ocellatus TaxID=259542 RepID=A0AAV4CC68_9GAST|nr:hypothetical protein PoB_005556300 [Plakobranchus ocellatus]